MLHMHMYYPLTQWHCWILTKVPTYADFRLQRLGSKISLNNNALICLSGLEK
jgi:hypothetical protein